jgi:endonuclease YncB( thermonuclease family)
MPGDRALAVLAAVTITFSPVSSAVRSSTCELKRVIDGDTLEAQCDSGSTRIRLACIDAPETDQVPWGRRATHALKQALRGHNHFRAVITGNGRYDRAIAKLYVDPGPPSTPREINLELVRRGRVAVYHRYCDLAHYSDAEAGARRDGRGIWSEPGPHRRPWVYRH